MRTTIDLADDVAAAVAKLRRERGLGLSEAVNELVRAGLREPGSSYVYRPQTYDLGARIDLTNIGEVLGQLDDEALLDDRTGHGNPERRVG